jgi:hypothetical protein
MCVLFFMSSSVKGLLLGSIITSSSSLVIVSVGDGMDRSLGYVISCQFTYFYNSIWGREIQWQTHAICG